MNAEFLVTAIIMAAYHGVGLLVSGCVIWMGYRLLRAGIFESKDSEITATLGDKIKVAIKRAAPGTAFAVFGAVMFVVAMTNGPRFAHEADASVKTVPQQATEGQQSDDEDEPVLVRHYKMEWQRGGHLAPAVKAKATKEDYPDD